MTIARKLWLPWIEEERKIDEENGLKFTPDEFLDAKRFEALKKGLDRQTRGGADEDAAGG